MAKKIDEQLEAFRNLMHGPVLTTEDENYDNAREVWNSFFDKHPTTIARCLGAEDVINAVNFAKKHGMPISVRSGGHDYAGNSAEDDSLMIDLSLMSDVQIDPESKTAQVQPGATWGKLDNESQAFGLATPGATVSTVGVAGFILGGGSGYLSRKYGMGCDNLVSAEVVTAEGELVHASKDENADLFWAIRGGGGNFGIVISFELQLHEVGPKVLTAQIFHPFEDARNVLDFYRSFMAEAPDELLCYAFIIPIPPSEPFPEEQHGKPALALIACYAGESEKGNQILEELENFGDPILGFVQPILYTELQKTFDEGVPKGLRWYTKAHYFNDLTDDIIDRIIESAGSFQGSYTMVYLSPEDGAINKIDASETAFPHREASYGFHILAGWDDAEQDDEIMSWVQNFHLALDKHTTGGVYVNLLGHDERERVPQAYGTNYNRLQEIKRKWDPENLFSSNHNIPPAG